MGSLPAYLRKIDRASDLDGDEDKSSAVFRSGNGGVSVFLATSADDIPIIFVGLNSKRTSLTKDVLLLPISPYIIERSLRRTRGNTACDRANSMHFDILMSESELSSLYFLARRDAKIIRVSGNKAKETLNRAVELGCGIARKGTCEHSMCL